MKETHLLSQKSSNIPFLHIQNHQVEVQVVLVAQHTFVSSDPWPNVKMVGAEVDEGDFLEAGKLLDLGNF